MKEHVSEDAIPFFVERERIELRTEPQDSNCPVAFIERACLEVCEDKSTYIDYDQRKRCGNILQESQVIVRLGRGQ